MSDGIWVQLEPYMIEFVDEISDLRTEIAEMRGADQEGRDRETRLRKGREGYRAEAAGRLYFGRRVKWSIKKTIVHGKLDVAPDFSDFIDVKGRVQEHHRLCIKESVWFADRAYLLVCGARHPRYRMVAWCWGHELTSDHWGEKGQKGRPAWWVDEDDPIMKPPEALRKLALARTLSPQLTTSALLP